MRLRWVIFKLFKHEERAQLTATWCSILSYFHNDVHKHNLVRNWLCKAMSTTSKMSDIFYIVFLTKTNMHMHTWGNTEAELTASWGSCTLSCFLRQTLVTNLLWKLLSTIWNMFDISPMAFHKLRTHKGTAKLTSSCKKTVGSALFKQVMWVRGFELPNVKFPTLILITTNFTACVTLLLLFCHNNRISIFIMIFFPHQKGACLIEFLGHKWSLSSYKTRIVLLTSVELQIKV